MSNSPKNFITTPGNDKAVESVEALAQPHDTPRHLFVVGSEKTGKTTLLRSLAFQKDLFSPKRVSLHAATEMVEAVRFNAPDSFFEDLGTSDVLLVDDFQDFYIDEDEAIGVTLCKLMLNERARLGLDTVIFSRSPLSSFDLTEFEGALDDFEELTIEPLDAEGRKAFVRAVQERYRGDDGSPTFTDDAVQYLANDFSSDLRDVEKAVRYFMTSAGLDSSDTVDADLAREALNQ